MNRKKMIRNLAGAVVEGTFKEIVLTVPDSKIKIWKAGDKFKVSRTGIRKEIAEA